jgi:predicted glycosyltransferase
MKILFYFSHPAQFHFSKVAIEELRNRKHVVDLIAKTKDVLTQLLDEKGWKYINIQNKVRKQTRFAILSSLLKRDVKLFQICRKNKYDLLIGTDASIAHIGYILNIPTITILEDDYRVIKSLAKLTFPFTKHILVPNVCDVGDWGNKKIGYDGYMKLAYLHPNVFSGKNYFKDKSTKIPYYLIRLSNLHAHHDFGIKGISYNQLDYLISQLEKKGHVFLSSEKKLPHKYLKYKLDIPASRIHHFLSETDLLICDSQSMAVEAAMLGTPNVRISSFSGKISVLEELENVYELTYGFSPEDIILAFKKIDQLLKFPNLKQDFMYRRNKMLEEKIDVSQFLIWFIENYPHSAKHLSEFPNYQKQFISAVKQNRPPVPAYLE